MKVINNQTETLKEDLVDVIKKGSKISMAAAYFSMFAFEELKEELSQIKEFRFLFTEPTFTAEKTKKERREFYIPRLNRERSIYGTDFEVKLRNELSQKAIAKECADWVNEKVNFRSIINNSVVANSNFLTVDDTTYMPVKGFTSTDLGTDSNADKHYFVTKIDEKSFTQQYLDAFDVIWKDKTKVQDVKKEVLDNIISAYAENSPNFIYFVALYNVFGEYIKNINPDNLPNEATGFKNSVIWNTLFQFQKDAALGIIQKLEQYHGCILADSVGLGKTFTALAVIKYYQSRNMRTLVLCPKKLENNWNTYRSVYYDNPLVADRFDYDVQFHTDLSRDIGMSNGRDLSRIMWNNYNLVVIDESHNFRNGGKITETTDGETKENRYLKLINKVIKGGVETKVLMLSATPVNNRFIDLKNQVALAYSGDVDVVEESISKTRTISDIFVNAQRAFTKWGNLNPEARTTEKLLEMLDFDFFTLLDSVTIARSRKHIVGSYDTSAIGSFPVRLKPESHSPSLTDLPNAIDYDGIADYLLRLNLYVYCPSFFIKENKYYKYADKFDKGPRSNMTQAGREQGIRKLMGTNLLKRLESSVYAFRLTLQHVSNLIANNINSIDAYKKKGNSALEALDFSDFGDFDEDDKNFDLFSVGKSVPIQFADMKIDEWKQYLEEDLKTLNELYAAVEKITSSNDSKLKELYEVIDKKVNHPINGDNKKIVIFTAFADTAEYLYENVRGYVKTRYNLNTAVVTGSAKGKTTIDKLPGEFNTILTWFSPISKNRDSLRGAMPPSVKAIDEELDILIATDCISEGQNLQDCDYLINYDIHWNPVRIIQRFGRIDRIGSINKQIQLVNFWPNVGLDAYIKLKGRVEMRMKAVNLAATGDDNILEFDDGEKADLEYRKEQLNRLKKEVVDLEDLGTGVSIMDLGLNDFYQDLIKYESDHPDIDNAPFGMHAVVPATENCPPGVIYVLKNISANVNIDKKNRLHPYYMVYVDNSGKVISNHLAPKKILDQMRKLCREEMKPIRDICDKFNEETDGGKNMKMCSKLLEGAIRSIINVKSETDAASIFSPGGTNLRSKNFKGLDDFELICFIVVR